LASMFRLMATAREVAPEAEIDARYRGHVLWLLQWVRARP
jgi:hypothetical protein